MSLSNVARSTAASLGRRTTSKRTLLSAVASSSSSSSSSPQFAPSARLNSTLAESQESAASTPPPPPATRTPEERERRRDVKEEKRRQRRKERIDQEKAQVAAQVVPRIGLNDPHLYHSLAPAPKSLLASLLARLGLLPADDAAIDAAIEQLRVALTHPSWVELRNKNLDDQKANEHMGPVLRESLQASRDAQGLQSNGSLATLGNSLLGLLASEHLHLQYPNLPTRVFKAALSSHVGPGTLVDVAVELGLGAKGVAKWDTNTMVTRTRGDLRPASSKDILAQAMRACVGLIFQRKGLAATRQFIHSHFLSRMPLPPTDFGPSVNSASATSSHPLASLLKFNDPKRSLRMVMDKYGFERPQSRLIAETGRLTQSPVFGVGVYSGTSKVGEGWGSAIRMAEYRAAEDALRRLYLRKSSPLGLDEIPSATLDADLPGSARDPVEEDAMPSSVGKDVWAVGEAEVESSSVIGFRPRGLGESEIVYDNKR